MPEPFKNLFNPDLVRTMGQVINRADPEFDQARFETYALDGLENLEMMARAEQISKALDQGLKTDFLRNLEVLTASLHPSKTSELADMHTDDSGIAGWAIVPLASYVARHGMDCPIESLETLRQMTMRFSTEFAVRFFLRDQPEVALATMKRWTEDDNFHVRRLASEGARPLLPWGIKLHRFVEDPALILPILEALRDDPSDYVRKSVANNLNDISKSHPDLVASLAKDWMRDGSAKRVKLVKHACRGLIKAGHPATLEVFGYGPAKLSNVNLKIPDLVTLGDTMPIRFDFTSDQDQGVLVDYVLHFKRANGSLSPKVFKWTERSAAKGQVISLEKSHAYRRVTTRKDYPGTQVLAVQVNGVEVARKSFEFVI